MRKILSLFTAVLFIPTLLSAAPARPDTLRLLCIGNSFSVDAVEQNDSVQGIFGSLAMQFTKDY